MLIDYKKIFELCEHEYLTFDDKKKMQNGTFEVEERIFKLL